MKLKIQVDFKCFADTRKYRESLTFETIVIHTDILSFSHKKHLFDYLKIFYVFVGENILNI